MEEAQRLLDAEKATHELLATLIQLRDQMGGYSAAKVSLDRAADDLRSFVQSGQRIAMSVDQSCETLKTLSMPEVLSRVAALRTLLEGLVESMQMRADALSADVRQNGQETSALLSQQVERSLANVSESSASLLREAHEQCVSLLERLGRQSREQVDAGISAFQASLQQIRADIVRSVDASLAKASDSQEAKVASMQSAQQDALAANARVVKSDLDAATAAITSAQMAANRSLTRLRRIVLFQSVLLGLMALATLTALVLPFLQSR